MSQNEPIWRFRGRDRAEIRGRIQTLVPNTAVATEVWSALAATGAGLPLYRQVREIHESIAIAKCGARWPEHHTLSSEL